MTGLVIKQPWIDLILDGKKTWEIRGSTASIRGKIALIQSKSGKVVGTCDVVGCIGPIALDELRRQHDKHRIPLASLGESPYPKTYAWVLANAVRFQMPLPYQHPSGAVIWVRLSPENCSGYGQLV